MGRPVRCSRFSARLLPRHHAFEGNDPTIPWDETNLIFKAARLLQERFAAPGGAEVSRRRKTSPPVAGLAGGSSNAAMTTFCPEPSLGAGPFARDARGSREEPGGRCSLFFLRRALPRGRARRPADRAHRPAAVFLSFWPFRPFRCSTPRFMAPSSPVLDFTGRRK